MSFPTSYQAQCPEHLRKFYLLLALRWLDPRLKCVCLILGVHKYEICLLPGQKKARCSLALRYTFHVVSVMLGVDTDCNLAYFVLLTNAVEALWLNCHFKGHSCRLRFLILKFITYNGLQQSIFGGEPSLPRPSQLSSPIYSTVMYWSKARTQRWLLLALSCFNFQYFFLCTCKSFDLLHTFSTACNPMISTVIFSLRAVIFNLSLEFF